jgi:hypothetical protein
LPQYDLEMPVDARIVPITFSEMLYFDKFQTSLPTEHSARSQDSSAISRTKYDLNVKYAMQFTDPFRAVRYFRNPESDLWTDRSLLKIQPGQVANHSEQRKTLTNRPSLVMIQMNQ